MLNITSAPLIFPVWGKETKRKDEASQTFNFSLTFPGKTQGGINFP
jgi:hypothetical protein